MIKIPHKHKLTWDYDGWKTFADNPWTQEDWNNTLITKINQLSNIIFKDSLRGGGNVIRCSSRVFNIIKNIEYYNSDTNMLGGRFNVIMDDLIFTDSIYVYASKVLTEHNGGYDYALIPKVKKSGTETTKILESPLGEEVTETEWDEISFVLSDNKKKIKKYYKKLVGKIKILNYENEKKEYIHKQINSHKGS